MHSSSRPCGSLHYTVGIRKGEHAWPGTECLHGPRFREPEGTSGRIRLANVLGIAYVGGLFLAMRYLTGHDRVELLVPAGFVGIGLLALAIRLLPDWALYRSPLRQVYSTRLAGLLRMSYYTVLLVGLAHLRCIPAAGRRSTLSCSGWCRCSHRSCFSCSCGTSTSTRTPMTGRLTNSRVFFTDFFTRWAVFVYGQDMHIPHHLFPAVPHYRLEQCTSC